MISLRKLADISDVSVATVSKALRDDPRITPEVRVRIKRIAREHHYRPNHRVRGVVEGRTRQVGILMSDIGREPLSQQVSALVDALERRGFAALVYNTHNDRQKEASLFHNAVGFRVSGLIMLPHDLAATEPHFKELRQNRIPFVVLSEHAASVDAPHVRGDDEPAAEALVDHLWSHGHRRIGCIVPETAAGLLRRADGYRAALRRHGIDPDERLVVAPGWRAEDGATAMARLLDLPNRPTAVLAASDELAAGAMKAAHERGVSVPGELSVTGFGNARFASWLSPSLTTVENRGADIADAACRVLEELLDLPALTDLPPHLSEVVVPRGLVLRDSVAAANASDHL